MWETSVPQGNVYLYCYLLNYLYPSESLTELKKHTLEKNQEAKKHNTDNYVLQIQHNLSDAFVSAGKFKLNEKDGLLSLVMLLANQVKIAFAK